ncbi:myosin-M heavy protein [Parasponia andersonii]|uniref:Myosin-M heavy protein n=1 Tax=Parasponia andersonii TaxID=3476 RepID=A0A2P5B3J2_PARAD|nr:myosin-M heavy protein [Parasponia andersonii]
MGKQPKAKKKSQSFGTGDVTPKQVAFIVDRYLFDNNFPQTRSLFRSEAASLIAHSPTQEATKGILSLGEIINEYISLKGQKLMVDQERVRLEQEKFRVQTLLQSMQNAMSAYNAGGSSSVPAISSVAPKPAIMAPQLQSVPTPSNNITQPANFSSPMTNYSSAIKRKDPKVVSNVPPPAKRSRSKLSLPEREAVSQLDNAFNTRENAQASSRGVESAPNNSVPTGSLANGSTVAKCLFNLPSFSTPANTSVPKTPPRANSSQSDKSISPLEISSTAKCSNSNTPEQMTPTRCTVISSSKRVTVSPFKHMAYYVEKNQCISTSSPVKTNLKRQPTRDHVKGRLDFEDSDPLMTSELGKQVTDQTSTSESEKEIDIFDIDLPNFDAMGTDFSFTEMLGAFDFECEEMGFSCQPAVGASADTVSGSSPESMGGNIEANQVMSEFSTMTEVVSQQDMSMQGLDSMTAVKSVTRCIKIISPVKTRGSSLDQNCSATN